MSTADGTVLPNPGIPKTLGILNVIFGVLLVLFGTCLTGVMVAAPALMDFSEKAVKDVQAKNEARRKTRLDAIDEREKAAKSDEEKKAFQGERDAIAAEPKVESPDMGPVKELIDDPMVKGYNLTYFGTGVLLSILLLVSGIGLVRLTPWGRSLAVWWAGLQIVQILALAAVGVFYVQPEQRPKAEAAIEKIQAKAKAKAQNLAPGMAEGLQFGKAMQGASNVLTVGWVVVGMIYPVTVLVLLGGAGARAACRATSKPAAGPGEF